MGRERSPVQLKCGPPMVVPEGEHAGEVMRFEDGTPMRLCAWSVDADRLGAAEFTDRDGSTRVLHRSTRPDAGCKGRWQVSEFSADGTPWGHACATTPEKALEEYVGYTLRGRKMRVLSRRGE